MADNEQYAFRNSVKQAGFVIIPHAVGRDRQISDGAYRTLAVYIRYAQQKSRCWPGRDRIAQERGVTPKTITRHNVELVEAGYITRKRRVGTSSLTLIEDFELSPRLQAIAQTLLDEWDKNVPTETKPEWDKNVPTDRTKMSREDGTKMSQKEEQVKEEQVEGKQDIIPSLSKSETPEKETAEERMARLRKVHGSGPLEGILLATARGASDETSFTVPAAAGGADPYMDGPLTAWCVLVGKQRARLQGAEEKSWAAELRRIAEIAGADAKILAWALRQWQRAIIAYHADKTGGRTQVWIPGNIAWMTPTTDTLFIHKSDPARGIAGFLRPLIEWGMEHGPDDIDLKQERAQIATRRPRSELPPRMEL